jgi:hypothetical protein
MIQVADDQSDTDQIRDIKVLLNFSHLMTLRILEVSIHRAPGKPHYLLIDFFSNGSLSSLIDHIPQ